jgi:hypothetical protein
VCRAPSIYHFVTNCTKREKAHGPTPHTAERAAGTSTRAVRPPFELGSRPTLRMAVYETTAGSADLASRSELPSSPTAIPRRLETYTAPTITAIERTAMVTRSPTLLSSP